MELAAPPRGPLGRQQRQHEQQRHQRDLRGAGQIGALQPGRIDADRQGRDAQVLHGTEIVEALHQRQRDAGRQRRPRQGQRHRPEGARRGAPERARHLQHADRLLHEARARGEIDVGVEHRRQRQHGAGERAHLGEPVVLHGVPAEQCAQRPLHRAGEVEQLHVAVGDDVGRHGERQHEQAVEQAAAGEAVHGDEPCRARADEQREDADAGEQQQGVGDRGRQDGARQVRPHALARGEREDNDRPERQRHEGGKQRGKADPGRRHGLPPPPAGEAGTEDLCPIALWWEIVHSNSDMAYRPLRIIDGSALQVRPSFPTLCGRRSPTCSLLRGSRQAGCGGRGGV